MEKPNFFATATDTFFPLKYWQKIDLCLKDVLVFSEINYPAISNSAIRMKQTLFYVFFLFSDFPFLVEAEVMSMKTVLPTNQVLERSADLSMIWSEGL